MTEELPAVRPAARLLVLDERDRLLLFASRSVRPGRTIWIPPGGGVQDGETFEQAAVREAFEETGLRIEAVGPWVWTRTHRFAAFGRHIEACERYFLVRCPAFEPIRDHLEDYERTFIEEFRWWTAQEIAESRDWFVPRSLARLLPALAAGDVPARPIDCGV